MTRHGAPLLVAIFFISACAAGTDQTTVQPSEPSHAIPTVSPHVGGPTPSPTTAPTEKVAPSPPAAVSPEPAAETSPVPIEHETPVVTSEPADESATEPADESATEPAADPAPTTVTVEPGDTLGEIADEFGITVDELRAWNHERYSSLATDADLIEVGWTLALSGSRGATLPPQPTPAATPEPTPDPTPVTTPAPVPTPTGSLHAGHQCTIRDWLTPFRSYDLHHLTVLDWTYMVGPDYVPPDLVSTATAGFTGVSGDKLIRQPVISDLAALRQAAAEAGHAIEIQSAYRSYETQAATFDFWVGQAGFDEAVRRSARPGHSEHQLGTTIDFTSGGMAPWEYADWGATPAGAWMGANAWRFGWVLTLPAGASGVTCYDYEPWHFRWVGRAIAEDWWWSGLVFRDYQVRLTDVP